METADRIYECRARGIFRKNGVIPLAGDHAVISVLADGTGSLEEILPRRNLLLRPPVANVDRLIIVVSVHDPEPNILIIDTIIAIAENSGIEPVLIFSKIDMQSADSIYKIYLQSGITCFCTSSATGEGISGIKSFLTGKVTVLAGNSGVGKSSLLNAVFQDLHLQTGETSRKLGRGKHTTRQVELLKLKNGGYVADTPGFSSISLENSGVSKENLQYCFREFTPFLDRCRFTSCSHTCEKGCAVLQAVKDGKISQSRHNSYAAMYREMKEWKEWTKR